jgi:molecular chaperone GrpE
MTDTTANPPAEPANDEAAPRAAAAPAAPAEAPVDPLEAVTREAAELKDRLLRALAEMENLRRRSEREATDARLYGIAGFARDVLGVADNMRRALDSVGADLRERADEGVKSLIDGVDLTERELLKVMEKHGIKRIDPQGEKFDPNFHQAVYEVPDSSVAAGTVVQVMQAGYKLGERVLRPAMVGIAKGGPKPGNGAASNGGSTAEAGAAESTSQGTPDT